MTSIDDTTVEAFKRSFLLGTARNPAPMEGALRNVMSAKGPDSELMALALIGQRMRFRRHPLPPLSTTGLPADDPRTIVPEAARALMRRLVAADGGSANDVAALAVADAFSRRRLRPHPFDLPRLAAFVRTHAESLGAYVAAWVERNNESEKRPSNYFDADAIDSSNWTSARPAERTRFIVDMRGREPDRARALVEASFANDPAPVRARLLDALARGLSPADVPFLESLAKDRAPSVRERAQRLLKFIPGTASAQARIGDLVARAKIGSAGLLRRRKALSLELPANLPAEAGRRWAAEEYAGVGLDAMAAAFGMSVADMVAAASDDAPLLALFARQASLERRFDVLAAIVREHSSDAWIDAIPDDGDAQGLDDSTIEQWCAAALAPALWPALPAPAHLDRLYVFLRRPLPLAQTSEVLASRAFAGIAAASSPPAATGPWSIALTALTPASLRSQLRRGFAPFTGDEISRALLLLDCLELLDPLPSEPESHR
jgi:Family of unknown function (DUF5691)